MNNELEKAANKHSRKFKRKGINKPPVYHFEAGAQWHAEQSKKEAIEFAEWIDSKGYMRSSEIEDEGKWTSDWKNFKTTQELFELFRKENYEK